MADRYSLDGSARIEPLTPGINSFAPTIIEPLQEVNVIDNKQVYDITLSADAPVSVQLGGITNVKYLHVRCTSKIKVRLTSADGATQSIPVDPIIILHTTSVPITAIDLTRVSGTDTVVRLVLMG